ncbi:hypothetical protein [Pedobacter sp. ASV28]|uniref:hypothetical protein n=1 Tax=Pedobacter sp. ASV28 TaxID=2795123 RepID=UPI0018EA33B1|nr:hypothetical protein [Pedobacter sp. ASV28]
MKTIEYFKLQAKKLHKDFKTQESYFDPEYGRDLFRYAPKFFDIDALVLDFDIDEDNFTLMNAQHYIALLAGFRKWTDLLKASPSALELSKLLFDNMHKVSVIEWDIYISGEERDKGFLFDDEFRLDIFKAVFDEVDGHQSDGIDYRLARETEIPKIENQNVKPKKKEMENKITAKITALPLMGEDRIEFIKTANEVFEHVIERLEPENPDMVRKLWNAEKYIDEELLRPDMLPIDRDYALSLIGAFLVHHVIELAVETDEMG